MDVLAATSHFSVVALFRQEFMLVAAASNIEAEPVSLRNWFEIVRAFIAIIKK